MIIISIVAAICSTLASLPQLLGKTENLSNVTMSLRCSGAVLWTVYGLLRREYALIIASSITGVIELVLIFKTNRVAKPAPSDTVSGPTGAATDSFPVQTLTTRPGKHG